MTTEGLDGDNTCPLLGMEGNVKEGLPCTSQAKIMFAKSLKHQIKAIILAVIELLHGES